MVQGPFLSDAPHVDAVVRVRIDGQQRCGAVFIGAHLALSLGSCFLRSLPLSLADQAACVRGDCDHNLVDPSTVRLIGGSDARSGPVVARIKRITVRVTAWWAAPDVTAKVAIFVSNSAIRFWGAARCCIAPSEITVGSQFIFKKTLVS